MTLVVDASAVVAALTSRDTIGSWAESTLLSDRLVAPHLMLAEAGNTLRRAELSGALSPEASAMAYADLLELPFDAVPFEPFAERIWLLRTTVTVYDAWYIAVAEAYDAPLATLDLRLARAPGPNCRFETPPMPEPG